MDRGDGEIAIEIHTAPPGEFLQKMEACRKSKSAVFGKTDRRTDENNEFRQGMQYLGRVAKALELRRLALRAKYKPRFTVST